MSDRLAFLRAIAEDFEDDLPRLVFADWLEENGDPDRAEFIRVQCRLAAMGDLDPGRPELELRERQLLRRHGDRWAGELPEALAQVARGNSTDPRRTTNTDWDRGFLSWFLSYSYLSLAGIAEAVEEYPVLGDFGLRLSEYELRRFMNRNFPPVIRKLTLSETQFRLASTLSDLVSATPFASLIDLRITQCEADGLANRRFVAALRESHIRGQLRGLSLEGLGLPADALRELFAADWPELRRLRLTSSVLPGEVLREWSPGRVPQLRELDLSFVGSGGEACLDLVECPALHQVESLSLTLHEIAPAPVRALITSRALGRLTRFRLSGTDDTAFVLSNRFWEALPGHLKTLDFDVRIPAMRRIPAKWVPPKRVDHLNLTELRIAVRNNGDVFLTECLENLNGVRPSRLSVHVPPSTAWPSDFQLGADVFRDAETVELSEIADIWRRGLEPRRPRRLLMVNAGVDEKVIRAIFRSSRRIAELSLPISGEHPCFRSFDKEAAAILELADPDVLAKLDLRGRVFSDAVQRRLLDRFGDAVWL